MADDKKMQVKEIELIVEQVLKSFKGLVLTPAPRQNRVEEHTIIIDCDLYENNGIETEIAIIDLSDRLMRLSWRTRDNIPMQIISLLHEAHVVLNVNHERFMERLTRDRVLVTCSQTPECPPILSCSICSHILELLYQHNVFHRALNRPVLSYPEHEPMEASTSSSNELLTYEAQGGHGNEPQPSTSRSRGRPSLEEMAYCSHQEQIDIQYMSRKSGLFHKAPADNNHNAVDFIEPQPSTSRWNEHSHAAQFHDQHVNANVPHRAFDTHEPMDATTSHRRDQHCYEEDSEMPRVKNAKFDEPSTSELNLPSTSGQRNFGRSSPIDLSIRSDYANSCLESSDDTDDDAHNAMAEAEEARRKKFHRIKKMQQFSQRKFKK